MPDDDDRPLWQRHWEALRAELLKEDGRANMPAENSVGENQNTQQDNWPRQNSKEERIREALATIDRTLKEEGTANRREERREDTGNKWLQGFTLFFVILTTIGIAVQAYIFKSQLDEMRGAAIQTNKLITANASLADAAAKQASAAQKQADALAESASVAHDNMILAERAWVGPNNAAFDAELAIGKPINIVITYQNSGHEPAVDFLFFANQFEATTEEVNNGIVARTIDQYMQACKAKTDWHGGSVAFPSTGFSAYNLNVKTKDDFVDQAIIKGDKLIFFQGCFIYRSFDLPRHSYFCYFYKQGQTKIQNLNICPGGHYAD